MRRLLWMCSPRIVVGWQTAITSVGISAGVFHQQCQVLGFVGTQ